MNKLMNVLIAGLFLICPFVQAHHPVASRFILDKTVKVKGVLKRVEFGSPHTYLFIESEVQGSKFYKWQVEWSSFPSLHNFWSINKESLKPGTQIQVNGYRSKSEETNMLLPIAIETSDGIDWRRMKHSK